METREIEGIELCAWIPSDPWAGLVFGPGTGASPRFYRAFLENLQTRGIAAVGFSPPGIGGSEGRRGDFVLEDYARCARLALEYLRKRCPHLRRVIYAGWSQGGLGGTVVADRLRDLFNGYFLHNPAVPTDVEAMRLFSSFTSSNSVFDAILKTISEIQVQVILKGLARVLPGIPWRTPWYLPLKKIFEGDVLAMRNWLQDPDVEHVFTWRAIASLVTTRVGDLSRIGVPIEVYYPERDIPPRSHQEGMARLLNADFVKAEGLGHSAIRLHPKKVADAVVEFIESLAPRTSA